MIINIIFLIGLAMVLYAFILKYLDVKAKNWDTTLGEIVSSEMRRTMSDENHYTYKCDFNYTYKPKGMLKELTGKNLFRGMNSASSRMNEHLNICTKLARGTKVRVYYNPSNPKKSCLVVGENYQLNFVVAVGLFFMLLSLGIFLTEFDAYYDVLTVIKNIKIVE